MAQEEFDLSEFLCDSLDLQSNIAAPLRPMTTPKPYDYYKKFVSRDPYEILGLKNFEIRDEIAENIVGTPIQEFYRGANVLITGGTGFVGKILTEKLIRSVPNIGHIYLLIRSKRGMSTKERFEKLMEDKVFARMKAEVPDYAERLTAVIGDIGSPGLGLSPSDHRLLVDRINVVFHSAADVRFLEPLRSAISSNVLGSRRVLELAKEMKNLKSYVHVSTAYSQCVNRVIEERVPRMNFNYQELLDYIESKPDEELIEETPRLLQGWPNTYAFTKAICEDMLNHEAKGLPVCIFRPSVVTPSYREPVRGWTDNMYGPMGLFTGAGHGILHCIRLKGDIALDIVPVDYVVNCMVAAAWKTADKTNNNREDLIVYNFTSTSVSPGHCWKSFVDVASSQTTEVFPFQRAIWYTSFIYTESHYIDVFLWYLLHKFPGACLDKLAELTGGRPILTKIYNKVEKQREQFEYFTLQEWIFKNENVMELWWSLGAEDKKLFNFDLRDVDLQEHLLVSKLGVRYYYMKEEMETIPAATRKNTWLYWLHNSVKFTCAVLALKLLVATARALPF